MATNPNFLAGIAYLTVDGKSYMLAGDLSYQVSTRKRTTLTGQDAVHGYSEEPVAGFIACNVRDSSGLSLADVNAMSNVTVVAELANGKVITGRNMWTVDAQEVKTTDATFPVRWEGISVEEA